MRALAAPALRAALQRRRDALRQLRPQARLCAALAIGGAQIRRRAGKPRGRDPVAIGSSSAFATELWILRYCGSEAMRDHAQREWRILSQEKRMTRA
jgi:hypothetical protein